jgi:hypothetical protein
MAIEPVRVPDAVGVNLTVSVQLAPAPSDAPQLFVCAKSPVAAPMESVVERVPVFFTDTVWLVLVVPTSWPGKVRPVGVGATTMVPPVPVPDRVTVCGELFAESVIEIVPGSDPFAVGVNVTVTVQLVPTCNRVPQLFIWL